MFIRKRGSSHQLLESYRHDGTVRHRTVCNLGPHPTPRAALKACTAELRGIEVKLQDPPERELTGRLRAQADRMRRASELRRRIEELKAVVVARTW
jgi:hypothetical protein